ncbi:hypothetical protein [Candidatus Poriferisodalis sp.]|uniref:hypothetical protein n=1 Tax=Candidatus Poriferisodalis sp. TaxID=3101277 RepID=UPI003D10AEDC
MARRSSNATAVRCSHKVGGGSRQCENTTTDPSGLCYAHSAGGGESAEGQAARSATATRTALAAAQSETSQLDEAAQAEVECHNLVESENDTYLLEIVAARDLPEFDVQAGDQGGLVEPGCIVSTDSWVDENSRVLNDSKVLNGSLVANGSEVRSGSTMDGSRLERGSTLAGRSTMIDSQASGACEIRSGSTVEASELMNECRVVAGSTVEKCNLNHHCLIEASTARGSILSDDTQITGGSTFDNSLGRTSEVRDGSVVIEKCILMDRAKVLRGSKVSGESTVRQFATLSDGAEMRNKSCLDGACDVGNGTILDNTEVRRRVSLQHGEEIKDSVITESEVSGWHTTRARPRPASMA